MIFEAHQNPYFVRLYCINILTKHIFNYKIVKNRSLFLYIVLKGGGGGGACGKKMWKENVNQKMLR